MNVSEIVKQFHISEEVYNGFLACFNDHNPLHTNSAFAKGKGFQEKVMHGNILNGFLSYMIGEELPDKNVIIHKQSIKYHNPYFLGDDLTCILEQTGYVESVKAVSFNFSFVRGETKIASGKIQIGII